MTSGILRNYYRDEVNYSANESNDANNCRIKNNKTTTSKSFEYKTNIIGSTLNNNSRLNTKVVVPWKYTELDLTWSKYWLISEMSRAPEVGGAISADATLTTGATSQINNA